MQVAYSYNQVGELTTVTPSGTGSVPAVTYAYDPSGRVSTVKRQSQTPVTTAAVYDAAGQLTSLSHSSTSGVLDGYGITRDVRGNPTQVDTTTGGAGGGSTVTSSLYTYDAVSRLRTECYPVTGAVCTAKSPRNAYTYDLVGNRATETARTVAGTKATTVSTDYTYDAAYQLLTKSVAGTATVTNTWSPNGALATSTTPTGTQTYTTDLTDELTSLTLENGSTVGYTQDAQGNRTSRTVNGLLDATWAWDDVSSLPMRGCAVMPGHRGARGGLLLDFAAVLADLPDHHEDHDDAGDDQGGDPAHGRFHLGVGAAGQVSGGHHDGAPEDAACGIEGEELAVGHPDGAGKGGHDGPEEGGPAAQEDRGAAAAGQESLGVVEAFSSSVQDSRGQNARPDVAADFVADAVAEDRCGDHHNDHGPEGHVSETGRDSPEDGCGLTGHDEANEKGVLDEDD